MNDRVRADSDAFLRHGSAHDYSGLIEGWRAWAEERKVSLHSFAQSDEYLLYWLASSSARDSEKVLYLSAGVHGDEPAGPWALLQWSLDNVEVLAGLPWVIFPCFNPWGLVHNLRTDPGGEDFNRCFDKESDERIAAWRRVVDLFAIETAVSFHEDYDAGGIYAYELTAVEVPSIGDHVLAAGGKVIPRELRSEIEGREAKYGLIHRNENPVVPEGKPEAIRLRELGVPRTLTIETPSEYAFKDRVQAHMCCLSEVVQFLVR